MLLLQGIAIAMTIALLCHHNAIIARACYDNISSIKSQWNYCTRAIFCYRCQFQWVLCGFISNLWTDCIILAINLWIWLRSVYERLCSWRGEALTEGAHNDTNNYADSFSTTVLGYCPLHNSTIKRCCYSNILVSAFFQIAVQLLQIKMQLLQEVVMPVIFEWRHNAIVARGYCAANISFVDSHCKHIGRGCYAKIPYLKSQSNFEKGC